MVEWLNRKIKAKNIINKLKLYDNVVKSEFYNDKLIVEFDTGIIETWHFTDYKDSIISKNYQIPYNEVLFKDCDFKFKPQFESNLADVEDYEYVQKHFIMAKVNPTDVGWCTFRINLHKLVKKLKFNYSPIKYPKHILLDSYYKYLNEDIYKYQSSKLKLSPYVKIDNYKRLFLHFLGDDLKHSWDPNAIYYGINKSFPNVSAENIAYYSYKYRMKIINPSFYRIIFKQWFNGNTMDVLDISGDYNNSKLFGVLINNVNYHTNCFNNINNDVVDFLDKPILNDCKQKYDLIICNDCNMFWSIDDINKFVANGRHIFNYLMVYIDNDSFNNICSDFKLVKYVRIKRFNSKNDDYIVLISQK